MFDFVSNQPGSGNIIFIDHKNRSDFRSLSKEKESMYLVLQVIKVCYLIWKKIVLDKK